MAKLTQKQKDHIDFLERCVDAVREEVKNIHDDSDSVKTRQQLIEVISMLIVLEERIKK